MPFVRDLYVRDQGTGDPPIVVLHGGWGYGFYPFDHAIAGIAHRFVIPDRSGYGKSPPRSEMPPDFHDEYANETFAVLDALAIDRCILWGHSDGAVIAVRMALREPARCVRIVLEALHVERAKPRSREFFQRMANDPDAFGQRVTGKLAAEHGQRWRDIIRADGRAWLDIASMREQGGASDDLFDGCLRELSVPTLVLHGTHDPRTEPDELDRLRRDVPHAEIHMIEGGGHAPHSERAHAATCTAIVARFVSVLRSR